MFDHAYPTAKLLRYDEVKERLNFPTYGGEFATNYP